MHRNSKNNNFDKDFKKLNQLALRKRATTAHVISFNFSEIIRFQKAD